MNTKHFSDMIDAIHLCASDKLDKPSMCGIHFLVQHTKDERIVQLCATDKTIFIRTEMNLQFFTILFEKKYSVKFDPNIHVEGVLYLNSTKRRQLNKSLIQVNQKYPNIKKTIPRDLKHIYNCSYPLIFDFKHISKIQKIRNIFCTDKFKSTWTPMPNWGSKRFRFCIFEISEKTFVGLKILTVSIPPKTKKIPNFKKMIL